MDVGDIAHRFKYHPPRSQERVNLHESVRRMCADLAHSINDLCPDGREKSLAITHIEDAMMWANAALARQPDDE